MKDFPIPISTTRPETKLADTGVAVNPSDKRYKNIIGQTIDIDLAGHQIKVKVFADKEVDQEELNRLADLFQHKRVEVKPQGILNNL